MNSLRKKADPCLAVAHIASLTPELAWRLSNALDEVNTCLWEIFYLDFLQRCENTADISLPPNLDQAHNPLPDRPL